MKERSEDFTPFSSSSTIDKHSIPHLGSAIDLSRIPHNVCANSICRYQPETHTDSRLTISLLNIHYIVHAHIKGILNFAPLLSPWSKETCTVSA